MQALLDARKFLEFVGSQSASSFCRITHPVRRSVPVQTLFCDPVIPPRGSHASPALMFERGVQEGHRSVTEAAAPSLSLPHQFYASFIFPPARRGIDATLSSVWVNEDRPIHDGFVAQGVLSLQADARDGPSSKHERLSFSRS